MTPAALPGPVVLLLDPGPDQAREALERELARPEYQEPFLQRLLGWLSDLVSTATSAGAGLGAGAWLVVLVLLVAVLALALSRLRRDPVRRRDPVAAVFGGTRRDAADHEAAARAAYDAQRWDEAVVEAVRAVAVGLADRGLLPEQPGLTVHELVGEASGRFPTERDALGATGRAFDEVRYGDRTADERTAAAALGLVARLAAASPVVRTAGPVGAVPR